MVPPYDSIAAAINDAPGWVRVGITVRDARMRDKAVDALAAFIAERLALSWAPDPSQVTPPL